MNDTTTNNESTTYEPQEKRIQPFWERIPQFFAYPFNSDAATHFAVMTGATLVGELLIMTGSVLAFAGLGIILWCLYSMVKYGFVVLDFTARGRLDPPTQQFQQEFSKKNLPFKQFAVIIVLSVISYVIELFLPSFFVLIFALFIAFAMPASIMALGVTENILFASNPASLARIIGLIGWPYLALMVLLFVFYGTGIVVYILIGVSGIVLPGWLLIPLLLVVTSYFNIINYHMLGYVIYEHHEELGWDGVEPEEFKVQVVNQKDLHATAKKVAIATEHPAITEARPFIEQGNLEKAKLILAGALQENPDDEAVKQSYFNVIKLTKDIAKIHKFVNFYIPQYVQKKRHDDAVRLYEDTKRIDAEYVPQQAEIVVALAEAAFNKNRYDTAHKLLDQFAPKFPKSPLIPKAYLLMAKTLCEGKNADAQAEKILIKLVQKFPNCVWIDEINEYLRVVKKLTGHG